MNALASALERGTGAVHGSGIRPTEQEVRATKVVRELATLASSGSNILRGIRLTAIGLVTTLAWGVASPDTVGARREILTAEQKQRLRRVERVHVEAIALTDRGEGDPAGVLRVVAAQLSGLGFTVVNDPSQPHDVSLHVKCEQRKTWEGPVRSGGDADLPGVASHRWRGPACQIIYTLDGQRMGWRHEVRTVLEDQGEAARTAGMDDPGTYAVAALMARLQEDAFPLILAAEWGQTERLLRLLADPKTEPARKVTAISLLGNMFAVEAIPQLGRMAKDPDPSVAEAAAGALGAIGAQDGIPVLLELLQTGTPPLRVAAVKGLGRLAPLHPQVDIVPTLLEVLPTEPVPVQTEIVRALARTTDRRALMHLQRLNTAVQALSGADVTPEIRELKKALSILLDQYDGVHNVEY